MPIISTSLPSDGSTIDAADVNTPFNDILNVVNGNLDSDNLADDAVTADKIADGAVTQDKLNAASLTGWLNLGATPNTVTNNGNRSYDLVFNSNDLTDTLSEGMRLKLTRTTTAPTQSTSLNGTTQYWSKSSPTGAAQTDDITAFGWVYMTAYQAGNIISRSTSTNGWRLAVNSSGQVAIVGTNTSASDIALSSQSLPLNKWVHVAASLDMSGTSGLVYIDGVLVPSTYTNSGATAISPAGNLEVGSYASGTELFPGKIAQAGVSSTVLSAANIRSIMSQGLIAADVATYSIVSAFSFNGVATDINTTNANNLSASGSAGYTSDSPFASGNRAYDTAGTTEHAVISTKPTFSTNTTVTVQVPEGCAIPTSGGVSAVSYSTQSKPYGFPTDKSRWTVLSRLKVLGSQGSPVNGTWYNLSSFQINVPKGSWSVGYNIPLGGDRAGASSIKVYGTLSTANNSESNKELTATIEGNDIVLTYAQQSVRTDLVLTSATQYYLNVSAQVASLTNVYNLGDRGKSIIEAIPNFL